MVDQPEELLAVLEDLIYYCDSLELQVKELQRKLAQMDALKGPKTRVRTHIDPETSLEAAEWVQSRLSRRRLQMERIVQETPGLTAREILRNHPELDGGSTWNRLSELVHLGLVVRGTPRKCSVTRMKATTWWPISKLRESSR